MLKRLLTAVLILAIFMVFTGTAFSGPKNVPGDGDKVVVKHPTPDAAKVKVPIVANKAGGFDIDFSSITPSARRPIHGTSSTDTTICNLVDFYNSEPGTCDATYGLRSNAANPRIAERFDGPQAPNTKIKVNGVAPFIYWTNKGNNLINPGIVNVTAEVWTDLGGIPNTLAYRETFALPIIHYPSQSNYYYLPFTTPPVMAGSYHIAIMADSAGPSTDTLICSSDWGNRGVSGGCPAGTFVPQFRSSRFHAADGLWYPQAAINGFTADFDMFSDFCQVYSSCYTAVTPSNGYVGLWQVPDPAWTCGSTLTGFGQRFSSPGHDTVTSVDFQHYDYSHTYGIFYPATGTNAVVISIWGDDGTGNIDTLSGPLASQTIPGGRASLFPTTGGDGHANGWNHILVTFATPAVVFGPWHVTAKMTSTNTADGALLMPLNSTSKDPGEIGGSVSFTAPDPMWKRTGLSNCWTTQLYGEQAFFIHVNLCKDEFYQCQSEPTYLYGTTRFLYMDSCGSVGSAGSREGVAQIIAGGPSGVNRVDKIRFQIADEYSYDGAPDVPNSVRVSLFSDVGGNVGPPIWTTVLTDAQLTMYPGWTEVVIPGGASVVAPNFFVGMEPIFHLDGNNEWLYMARERVGDQPPITALVRGGMYVKLCSDGLWHQNSSLAGTGADNAIFEVDLCSTPPTEWPCSTPDDFATAGHDYGRTGHSNVAVSDAYCKLTTKWGYQDVNALLPAGQVGSSGPIVFDTFVVCDFGTKYQIFSLRTGNVLHTITGSGSPYYIGVGGGLNSTPTIAKITISGTPTNVLFIGGGSTSSIDAINMDDGLFDVIWSINSSTQAGLGYTGGLGTTYFVNFALQNIGGIDYLYFCTGGVKLWQAVAATGHKGTWGPVTFTSPSYRGLATDGTNLYLTTAALPPGVPNGDVWAYNATTGAPVWQLSVTAGGLKGSGTVYSDTAYGPETFPSGCAVSGGIVYTVSAPMLQPNPVFPADGVFYRIDAGTGALKGAVASAHIQCWGAGGNLQQGNVIIDAAHIIVPGGSTWATPPLGGTVLFYNSFTGLLAGSTNIGNHVGQNATRADGFLTCEPGAPDQLFLGSTFGYLADVNADNFKEIFNRRIDINPPFNAGADDRLAGLAIAKTGEVLVSSLQGSLYCLGRGNARARLEITNYAPQASTYGPLGSVTLDFGSVFTNTGCLQLTGSYAELASSDNSAPGAPRGYYPPSLNRAASIADGMTRSSLAALKACPAVAPNENVSVKSDRLVNRAATAGVPTFINGTGIYTFALNPGDSGHIMANVKQNLIKRGPNVFYVDFTSNDPDFFLNNGSELPECVCTIVGGCLIDTTTLHFGAAGANWALISNTGRVAHGAWTTANGSWFIDGGNHSDIYQGSYIYGVSYARIAINTDNWFGTGQGWYSLQADPNICDVDCKPALTSGVSLGSITSNGTTYTPLTGNLICRSILDSVQNFGPTQFSSWAWTNYTAFFDDTLTMGLYMTSRVVGFLNAPAPYTQLNNVVVDFLKVSQRDQTKTLPGWRMGAVIDYDLGNDTADYDASSSLAWDYPTTKLTDAWGWIKLPFGGCGANPLPPLRNVKALNEDQALFNNKTAVHGNGYLDSAYFDLNQVGRNNENSPAGSDAACHFGFIAHDFVPGYDTVSFAMAHFALHSLTNNKSVANYQPLAHLLNKWVGFDRGDVNNDGVINLADIVYLAKYINGGAGTPGPIPFLTCGDVNGDGLVTAADVTYLISYYFYYGPCPVGQLVNYK